MKRVTCLIAVTLLTWAVFFAGTAHAYLDPGTGSLIFQMIIAAFVGGLFALKIFWKRLKGLFTSNKKGEANEKGDL